MLGSVGPGSGDGRVLTPWHLRPSSACLSPLATGPTGFAQQWVVVGAAYPPPSAGPGPLGLQAAGQLGGPCFRARQAPPRPGGPLGPSSPEAPHPLTSVEAPHPHPGPGGWPCSPEVSDPRLAAACSWGRPPTCPPLPSPTAPSSSTTGAVCAWPSRVWCCTPLSTALPVRVLSSASVCPRHGVQLRAPTLDLRAWRPSGASCPGSVFQALWWVAKGVGRAALSRCPVLGLCCTHGVSRPDHAGLLLGLDL